MTEPANVADVLRAYQPTVFVLVCVGLAVVIAAVIIVRDQIEQWRARQGASDGYVDPAMPRAPHAAPLVPDVADLVARAARRRAEGEPVRGRVHPVADSEAGERQCRLEHGEAATACLSAEHFAARIVRAAKAQQKQAWESKNVSAIKAADAALAEAQEAARQIVGETQIVARGGVA